jgi:hypothetical protein
MANDTPVFPEVYSRTVVRPGEISPRLSASSSIAFAIRSFEDPPGFKHSSFARTSVESSCAASAGKDRRSRTSGEFPVASSILLHQVSVPRPLCISVCQAAIHQRSIAQVALCTRNCLQVRPSNKQVTIDPVTVILGDCARTAPWPDQIHNPL